jgi:hypothetical protein
VSKERLQEWKSVIIVMPVETYEEQAKEIYELRKRSIHVYDTDMISEVERLQRLVEVSCYARDSFMKERDEAEQKVERLEKAKENFLKEFNYEYGWQIQNVKNSKSQWHKGALRGFEHSKEIFDRHFQALETEGKE